MTRQYPKFLVALAFLNVLTNFRLPVQQTATLAWLLPSLEIFILLVVTAAAVRLGLPFRAAYAVPAVAVIVFLRIFILADFLVPYYLNRPFNLYIDSAYLPDLVDLLYRSMPAAAFFCGLFLLLVVAALVCLAVRTALKTVYGFMRSRRRQTAFWITAAFLFSAATAARPTVLGSATDSPDWGLMKRVAQEAAFIWNLDAYRKQIMNERPRSDRSAPHQRFTLEKLGGSDVYLFFIESYGRTVFENPDHQDRMAPVLRHFEESLTAAGFSVVSNFVSSPTYGGASWLAHGSVATGIHLNNQLRYSTLLSSEAQTAAKHFNAAGYRTVGVMPGTIWPWPEGAFYGYGQIYTAPDFGYQGPAFGWAPMPDQFVLDFVNRRELLKHTGPLFIEVVLISVHTPFNILPPYIDEWSRMGDGALFHRLEPHLFPVTWPELKNAADAYTAALAYDFKVIETFITRYARDDALILLMGDHQPNVRITGTGRSWSVPVHVVSRNPSHLQPFRERGYTPGVIPSQPLPHDGMEHVLFGLLADFSRSSTTGR